MVFCILALHFMIFCDDIVQLGRQVSATIHYVNPEKYLVVPSPWGKYIKCHKLKWISESNQKAEGFFQNYTQCYQIWYCRDSGTLGVNLKTKVWGERAPLQPNLYPLTTSTMKGKTASCYQGMPSILLFKHVIKSDSACCLR